MHYTLSTLTGKVKPIVITVNVNGTDILMEVDTGASLSVTSEQSVQQTSYKRRKLHSPLIQVTISIFWEPTKFKLVKKSVTDTSSSSNTRPWTKLIWEKLVRKDQDRLELYLLSSGTVISSLIN